jgi:polyribonucleotide nucleotidyltransferase
MKSPVAGVAMGLVMGEDGRYSVLTDIAGVEDHLGDMDFKVAGTAQGINALQMDIKVKGITYEVMEQALKQAREGRLFILDKMREAIAEPRAQVSPHAPKMLRMVIPVDKIGALIGPGGKTIRAIQEDTGVNIDTEDDGTVLISGVDSASMEKARTRVDALTREIRIGDIFTGKVMRITNFGAFVQLVPGKDGLIRLDDLGSDLDEDGLEMGQELTVMVQEIDHMGRINLSRRALFDGPEGSQEPAADRPSRPPFAQPRQGGSPPGARGGGPGNSQRPPPRQGGPRPPSSPGQRPSPSPRPPSFRGFSDR